MGEILQAALLRSLKVQYVFSQICLEVGLSAQCPFFSMFWNFLDLSRPGGQKTGTSIKDDQYI